MVKCLSALLGLWMSFACLAAGRVEMIHALGASSKGQFVAIEEYGYNVGLKTYYSRIKLMNVWKNEYVTPIVEVEQDARLPADLMRVREEAKARAMVHFEKFNIITSG